MFFNTYQSCSLPCFVLFRLNFDQQMVPSTLETLTLLYLSFDSTVHYFEHYTNWPRNLQILWEFIAAFALLFV